jgi:hypothetical protein
MSYDPTLPPYESEPDYGDSYEDYIDDLDYDDFGVDYDEFDCGGTGCGHCDYCDALFERDTIAAELRDLYDPDADERYPY